jgi:hypothetical protein
MKEDKMVTFLKIILEGIKQVRAREEILTFFDYLSHVKKVLWITSNSSQMIKGKGLITRDNHNHERQRK